MFFIFHAKPKRGVQTYFSIKQRENVVIKLDESSCQTNGFVFTLANAYSSNSWVSLCKFAHFSHSLRVTPLLT